MAGKALLHPGGKRQLHLGGRASLGAAGDNCCCAQGVLCTVCSPPWAAATVTMTGWSDIAPDRWSRLNGTTEAVGVASFLNLFCEFAGPQIISNDDGTNYVQVFIFFPTSGTNPRNFQFNFGGNALDAPPISMLVATFCSGTTIHFTFTETVMTPHQVIDVHITFHT